MLAAACVTPNLKPLVTPLCAIAMTKVAHQVMDEQDIFQPTQGDAKMYSIDRGSDHKVGLPIHDRRLPPISATVPATGPVVSAAVANGWADRA